MKRWQAIKLELYQWLAFFALVCACDSGLRSRPTQGVGRLIVAVFFKLMAIEAQLTKSSEREMTR